MLPASSAGSARLGEIDVLAQHDVARYLLDRGLLEPLTVLDGGLVIRDASSRNRNFRVQTSDGPCYMLKQGITPDAVASVAHEAAVYERLWQDDQALRDRIPRLCGYDAETGVLAIELVSDAEDLRTHHLRTGRFSTAAAASVGSALGSLHRATAAPTDTALAVPWILWVHRPDARVFRDVSAAGLELIRMLQATPGLGELLDALRTVPVPPALVHGDVKWDNCLVTTSEDHTGAEIRLIDWEIAAPGDPCWDIGSALSQYLSFWLFSIPVTGALPPKRFPELAAYPLDTMKPAISACWHAYADAAGLVADARAIVLRRAVALAGARLIQTAFEAAQMLQQLTSALVLHLQLAMNTIQRADVATTALLGLSADRPHPG